jgi:hypothetical protein
MKKICSKYVVAISLVLSPTFAVAQGSRLPCGYGPYGPIPCGQLPYPGPHVEGFPPRYSGPTPYPNYMGRGAPIMPGIMPPYQRRPWPYGQDYYGSEIWRY